MQMVVEEQEFADYKWVGQDREREKCEETLEYSVDSDGYFIIPEGTDIEFPFIYREILPTEPRTGEQ